MELLMRLLIQIQESGQSQPRMPEHVQEMLQSAGATQIRASHPELPGLFTAVVPDETDTSELLRCLLELPEVRNAEPDSFSTTL